MLDVMKELGELERLEPVARLEGAWEGSAQRSGSEFRTLFWLASKKEHLFFTKARNSYDPKLAKAIMRFVQEHEAKAIRPNPLVVLEGFKDPRGKFDAIATVSGEVHQMWSLNNERLTASSINVYPIYRCELSGDEGLDDLSQIIPRQLAVSSWNRDPQPVTRVRLGTVKSKAPREFTLTSADNLYEAIEGLAKSGSVVEAKNFRGQLLRIESREGALFVTPPEQEERKLAKKAAVKLATSFLIEGL